MVISTRRCRLDTHADRDGYAAAHLYTDRYTCSANGNTDKYCNQHTDVYSDLNRYTDAHQNANRYADTHANTNAYTHDLNI